MKILGLSGKAKHGKDTVASLLMLLYSEYQPTRRAFADALKEDIFNLLCYGSGGWADEYWAYEQTHRPAGTVDVLKIDFINSIKHRPEVRDLMQAYGVAQRAAQPDFWIQRCFKWASQLGVKLLIVPDVRFINEADAIREHGGLVLRVTRPYYNSGLTPEQLAHPSETELDNYEHFAGYIHNDGGIGRLRAQAQSEGLQYYIRKGHARVGVSGGGQQRGADPVSIVRG